jgi:hypothetical protein
MASGCQDAQDAGKHTTHQGRWGALIYNAVLLLRNLLWGGRKPFNCEKHTYWVFGVRKENMCSAEPRVIDD